MHKQKPKSLSIISSSRNDNWT